MIALLSPAKTQNFEQRLDCPTPTLPVFLDKSGYLVSRIKRLPVAELAQMLKISDKLAALNSERFKAWRTPFDKERAQPCIGVFMGDVYQGLDALSLSRDDLRFAQQHLRILSGLYGILRPLDRIMAYRLEMGSRSLPIDKPDLYAFWGERITGALADALKAQGDDVVINLASHEYSKVIDQRHFAGSMITPVFRENKNGSLRVIGIHAKKARGMMCRYMILNRLQDPEGLKAFNEGGYRFDAGLSSAQEWSFVR